MDTVTYSIDQICDMTGVSRRTVRYYVQEGLLEPPVGRGRGGNYLETHVERLREIKSLQEKGWTLSSIEKYLQPSKFPTTSGVIPEEALPCRRTEEKLSIQDIGDAAAVVHEEAAALPSAPDTGFRRTVRTTFAVAPGVEIIVDREVEASVSRKIQEIVRIAASILSRKE